MTEPASFFSDRTAEIIAAYGADSARWPDAERATALGVIALDPDLAAALGEARALDADLAAWARRPVARGDATAMAAMAMRRPRSFIGWAAGTGLAASIAAGIVLLMPGHAPIPGPARAVATDDATAFAQVFAATPQEEEAL